MGKFFPAGVTAGSPTNANGQTVKKISGNYLTDDDFPITEIEHCGDVFPDYWNRYPLIYWLRYKDEKNSDGNWKAQPAPNKKAKLTPEIWSAGRDGYIHGYGVPYPNENSWEGWSGALDSNAYKDYPNGEDGSCARIAAYNSDGSACEFNHPEDADNVGGSLDKIKK
jgi:hypothetical protein